MNEILTRIRVELARKGVTAAEMCASVGIPPTTYYTWVSKDREPQPKRLKQIAEYLGVSASYLLTGEDDVQEVTDQKIRRTAETAVQQRADIDALVKLARMLTPDEVADLIDMARFYLRQERIKQHDQAV